MTSPCLSGKERTFLICSFKDCAEDVILPLIEGAIANADRMGALIARQLVVGRLGEFAPTVDPVDQLYRAPSRFGSTSESS